MSLNLFNELPLIITGYTMPTIGWLGKFIGWIITAFGSIGVGIIVFTILLKLATFPLDFISRSKMRKNSLKMEQMRPQLEKLQKQYANDKALYQQKMAALYKKEGYSMFGACLPTIITLVIFIVVLSGFQNYSRFQNKEYLYHMSQSFDAVVYDGVTTDGEYLRMEDGKLVIDYNDLYEIYNGTKTSDKIVKNDDTLTIKASDIENIFVKYEDNLITYSSNNGYVVVKQTIGADGKISEVLTYFANENNLKNTDLTVEIEGKKYSFVEYKALNAENTAEKFIELVGQEESAKTFKEENQGFIWVKNIWQPDSAMSHPVSKDYAEFNKLYGDKKDSGQNFTESYTLLTAKLDAEKGQANGYFILVVLNVFTAWLLQFISGRAQKAQMELQSVDGQGKSTQKMMMWMMPLMMGFFAIYYTAAFSLYIVISSLYSIVSTLFINKLVDIKFAKDVKKQEISKDKRYRKQGE
ncbi:MAG: membrane protein insertase YidC [Clostridiales bacterium]|nr:membrane protein insertase YidC [Clostridiales bacterium]